MLLGAHVSISGGLDKAPIRGTELGCTAVQIFTKNQRQWLAKPLTQEEIDQYFLSLQKSSIASVIAHSSYLINLCSPDKNQLQKSRESFIFELERAEKLGIQSYVFHPGSHKGNGERYGIALIAESLNYVLDKCPGFKIKVLLETTAGQGTSLGYRFEQLKQIIDLVEENVRLGVCLDTCHIYAAGYDIRTVDSYEAVINEFDHIIGLPELRAIHLNDSKKPLGSRLDRHEQIGRGELGIEPFRLIMNDARFQNIPKILEIPGGEESYRHDLELLKNLVEAGNSLKNNSKLIN